MHSTSLRCLTPKTRGHLLALVAVLFLLYPSLAAGGIGELDPSFGTNGASVVWFDLGGGFYDGAEDMALQPDGKILLVGYAQVDNTPFFDVAVARLDASGQLDPTFGLGGRTSFGLAGGTSTSFGKSIAVQLDGGIIVAGYTSGPGPLNDHDFVIARLHADGSRDTAFGTGGETVISFDIGGQLFDFPERVLLQPDGKIVVVGAATESDTASDIAVARLTSSGALDSTFDGDGKKTLSFATGSGWKEDVNDALLQDDGKILIAGWVASNGDSGDFGVARLLPSGALDTTFSADGRTTISFDLVVGGSEEALGIALDKQGRILIHGTTAAPTVSAVDFAVARLLADGTLDPSFSGDGRTTIPVAGGDGWDRGVSVALDCTGRIVLLGDAHTLIPNADLGFAGLKPDGTLDPSFGNGGIRTVSFDLGGSNADSSRRVLIDTEGRPLALAEVTRSGPDDRDWAVVRLTGAGSCLFLDGFESGSTSAWSSP